MTVLIECGLKKIIVLDMRILVFGKDGQLGRALSRKFTNSENVIFIGRKDCDLLSTVQIENCLSYYKPQIIINASAYTNVDEAEVNQGMAFAINEYAVQSMATYCKNKSAKFIHFSTDYVFDGHKKTAYSELDICKPINVYGKSKYNGEKVIQNILDNDSPGNAGYMIIRTSWMYGDGDNFIRSILKLSKQTKLLKVISDQFGVPTSASWLAEITYMLIYSQYLPSGIFHVVPPGKTTWYDLANHVISCARKYSSNKDLVTEKVIPINSCDYHLLARRPSNSCLSTSKIQDNFRVFDTLFRVNWKDQVESYVSETITQNLV